MHKVKISLAFIVTAVAAVFLLSGPTAAFAGTFTEDIQVFAKDNPQGFVEFCRRVAAFYQQKGEFDQALSWTDRILRIQPNNLKMYLYKAQLLFAQGRFEDCEKILEPMEKNPSFAKSPALVSVRQLLYKSYNASGKLKEKEKALEKSLRGKRADKADIDTYRQLFMMYRASGSFDKTIKVSRKAIKLYPEESSFRIALAYAYESKGKKKKALNEYKKALEKFPDNLLVSFRIVDLDIELKLYDEANKYLDMVQSKFGKNTKILSQVRKYRQGIEHLRGGNVVR